MMKLITSTVMALCVVSSTGFAQTPAPKAPGQSAPAMDAAAEAKFKSADKDNNGMLNGAELTPFKADLEKIDANKDGSISRDEFASAVRSGVIK